MPSRDELGTTLIDSLIVQSPSQHGDPCARRIYFANKTATGPGGATYVGCSQNYGTDVDYRALHNQELAYLSGDGGASNCRSVT